jgi:hypothetical protein
VTPEEFDRRVNERIAAWRKLWHPSKPAHEHALNGYYHEVNGGLSVIASARRPGSHVTNEMRLDTLIRAAAIAKLAAEGLEP